MEGAFFVYVLDRGRKKGHGRWGESSQSGFAAGKQRAAAQSGACAVKEKREGVPPNKEGEQPVTFLLTKVSNCSLCFPMDLKGNIESAVKYLYSKQSGNGYWNAQLETNCCMEAQWLLASVFCGIKYEKNAEIESYILNNQRADGSWDIYFGAENGDVNTTVECYFALRVLGHDTEAEYMARARRWLLKNQWHKHIRVFTKYWLALFGEWPWEYTPALPPEIIYLPKWFPLNIYRFAAWARATILPLCVVTSQKPVMRLPEERRLNELFPEGRSAQVYKAGMKRGRLFSFKSFFNLTDKVIHLHNDKFRNARFHKKAKEAAMKWILEHQDDDGFWGGIQPPWIYGIIAMKLEGFDFSNENMAKAVNALNLHWTEMTPKGRRVKASESPVWDTMLAVLALIEAGQKADNPKLSAAVGYLLEKENNFYGDWAQTVGEGVQPSGWSFQRENKYYPDIDDTGVAIIALKRFQQLLPEGDGRIEKIESAILRAKKWILAMQSKNGGWGAFDKDNNTSLVTKIPFCDFGEVLDPPSVDVTAHVIEGLLFSGENLDSDAIQRAVKFIFDEQEDDGSWFGRWGINYVYGTWSALSALAACKFDCSDKRIRRGVDFLISKQNADGGWGESASTYMQPRISEKKSTASQTAWAVLALGLFKDEKARAAALRGAQYLKNTQKSDGSWEESEFTGTGFPGYGLGAKVDLRNGAPLPQGKELSRGFMLRYGFYCQYFPLAALSRMDKAM